MSKFAPDRSDPKYWEFMKRYGQETIGRPKAIPTPEKLWEYACEYFKRTDENKFLKQDFIRSGERGGQIVELETIRPYTWAGFEAYLFEKGIIQDLEDYRYNLEGRYEAFKGIIRAIDRIMYANKFEGAAVGAFNANIIARDLGLVDKAQVKVIEEQPLFGDEDLS